MIKITCYGVRSYEVEFFYKLNKNNFELNLVEDILKEENVDKAIGSTAVIIRGICIANDENIKKLFSYGIKYILTRATGINNIELKTAFELGIRVARVPAYSPNAIAELSLFLAMNLLRNISYTVDRTSKYDFRITSDMFSRELRNCKVGIIGVGKIGLIEAKLYKGLGVDVLGYDLFQNDEAKAVVKFVELEDLLKESDIISIHMKYIKGKNDKFINKEFISKMKYNSILINTARGELQSNEAILEGLKSNKLKGFATDVFDNEALLFFRNYEKGEDIHNQTIREIIDFYPRVLVTPHIGSNTDIALKNMIEISYNNLDKLLTNSKCENEIKFEDL